MIFQEFFYTQKKAVELKVSSSKWQYMTAQVGFTVHYIRYAYLHVNVTPGMLMGCTCMYMYCMLYVNVTPGM
jgi:hypothetical protein